MLENMECHLTLSYNDVRWNLHTSAGEKALLQPSIDCFSEYLAQRDTDESSYVNILSQLALASVFLCHVLETSHSTRAVRVVLQEFDGTFLFDTDIHTLASTLDRFHQVFLLRTYYAALEVTNQSCRPAQSALFREAEIKNAKPYAVFGGQGSSNGQCVQELSDLYSVYGGLVNDLLDVASRTLNRLVHLPDTVNYYEIYGFDIRAWLEHPDTAPPSHYVATSPVSFPIIGLISLAHYCITCKVLGKSPGDMRQSLGGLTGHSQGIIAAAVVARSDSWESFYDSAKLAVEMLFWIGFESHYNTPTSSLSATVLKDSIEAGEGTPSSMLSILGLDHLSVEHILKETNTHLMRNEEVYLALLNSRDNVVVGGPPKSLRGLNVRLRKLKATTDLDQSRILFNERKPVIRHQFLPISAAFHTPYLNVVTTRVLDALGHQQFSGDELGISLFHTTTGEDLSTWGARDIMESLVRMITVEVVDWPKACHSFQASHILDFGPGRVSMLNQRMTEGTGVRIILASQISPPSKEVGGKSDIFGSIMPTVAPDWGALYRPRLTRSEDGKVRIETKMSRLFGVPPIMVAGMTPTTVWWDFVATIMKAGYHVELAAGGYHSAKGLASAVRNISRTVQFRSGITINVIYASPRAIAWQIPLIRQLVQEGLPITGLTVGAGVPSAAVAKEYIETLGLKHISFKPGSYESILQVVNIARAHPCFTIGLQWTGGRGGGHHSYEDFHTPILENYRVIRSCANIVLIAGSGFGGASDTYPYLTGEWSRSLGYASMPFDGVLLGSRMMVAKEAHTSPQVKELIVQSKGVSDSEWHKSYYGVTGGVMTVNSEMGQPIHKLATRGVVLWDELDRKFFNIKDPIKRLAELQKHRDDIINRLNNDYQKPWFGVDSAGKNVEIDDMTYLEVLQRLVFLMYIRHQHRWIDPSYQKLVLNFAYRAQERLAPATQLMTESLDDPFNFLGTFAYYYPSAETELLDPQDVSFLLGLCKDRGQKPVNFVPKLDEHFEHWFKKDSLWQAEDIDAVLNRDAQRVCIIHGPVSARYSKIVDESSRTILNGITHSHIHMLQSSGTEVGDEFRRGLIPASPHQLAHVLVKNLPLQKMYQFPLSGAIPDAKTFSEFLSKDLTGWAQACLTEKSILRGHCCQRNPIRSMLVPCHGHVITVNYRSGAVKEVASIYLNETGKSNDLLSISSLDGKNFTATLLNQRLNGDEDVAVRFEFLYSSENNAGRVRECTHERNERIKIFYSDLWLGHSPPSLANPSLHAEFSGGQISLTRKMVQDFMAVIRRSDPLPGVQESISDSVPLDFCVVVAWEALVKPLLVPAIDGDLFRLLHRSNEFEYVNNAHTLRIGDVLETTSHIRAVTIQSSGKSVEVTAMIKRQGQAVVKVTSTFIIQGSFSDFANTFRRVEEPHIELAVVSEKDQALLSSRDWLDFDDPTRALIGKTFVFKLNSQVTYGPASQFTSLQVTGSVFSKNSLGIVERVGQVYFEIGDCFGNPVMDFLSRRGSRQHSTQPLLNPGWNGDTSWKIQIPRLNSPYARVSGDTNPIHVSQSFAKYVGLPEPVTHGMYTSAAVRRAVEISVAESDYTRFRRYSASFEDIVIPGDTLRVEMQHIAMIEGRMVLKIQAVNDATNVKVLQAEAEVEQATTAYVFTGQGSQEKGMGMVLYDSSPAVRDLWDRADKHLLDLYGNSILASA